MCHTYYITYTNSKSIYKKGANECLWFSLRLWFWFSNDVCSWPNSWRITNQNLVTRLPGLWRSAGYQRHDSWLTMAAWHWHNVWSRFAFTVKNARHL